MNAKSQFALEKTIEEPQLLWRKAELAMTEARLARETARRQIEQLQQDTGSRRRYRDAMLCKILSAAIARTNAGMGNIQLFDQRSGSLVIQTHEGFKKPFLDFFNRVESGQAACGVALRLRKRVLVDDVTEAEIFSRGRSLEVLLDSGVRSVQSTPLIGTSGQLLGVFSTHRVFTGTPNANELSVLDYFAAWTAALIEWHNRE
jgi:GAF domain-containing protein